MMKRQGIFVYFFYSVNIFFLLFFASCKSPYIAPTKQFLHATEKPVSDVNSLSVIVDSCVTIDALKDYISVEDSLATESYMTSAVKTYLEHIGYQIVSQDNPFVGGHKNPNFALAVKLTKKEKTKDIMPPFYIDEKFTADQEYQQCLMRVIKETQEDILQKENKPSELFKTKDSLKNDIQVLREHLKTRYLLVITSNSTFVPGLTSFSQAMLTGMATGIMTMGMVCISTCDVSYFDTYIGLIDLEQNELFWTNSLRLGGDFRKSDFYSIWNKKTLTYDGWAHSLLFYMPVKSAQFIEAAKSGDNTRLEWMILTGTYLNATDENQMTALHWTAKNNHLQSIKMLVNKGAAIDCQDADGNTPLHYATSGNQYNIAKFLLQKKANPLLKNKQGDSPLEASQKNQNSKLVKLLQKYQ